MTLEKLQVIIEAQTKAYYEELKKVQQQTKNATNVVERQTEKIKSAFGKIGKAIGLAVSVTALISFGKNCIELGSDLQEVQNVVDVTFGAMSEVINRFARDALEIFGLSETSAKKYTSTLGAMMKSMGLTTGVAAEMSMNMTGLAADMASFYNLDTDVAFEKIRSGISGETEPLKQLGINMSVANLQAFALSQGINKAYNAMSQQEQVMLRYNYLMQVTADAQGDFARTSDGWANQVRVLTERFNALKAAIGQGLIAVLTPVVRVLNTILGKILTVTDAFSNMIAKLTGKNTKTATTVSDIGGAADSAAGSMGNVGKATDKAGKSAKKAKKEFGGLLSMDEIHTLTKDESEEPEGAGGSGGGGGGAAGGSLEESIVDAANETDDSLNPVLEKLITKLKELQELFKTGFKSGIGDVDLSGITKAVDEIKESMKNIFTDPEVIGAADSFANTLAYSLGQVAGSAASIGITIATNLLGGINKYLKDNQERIKKFIVSMFDVGTDVAGTLGDFSQAIGNIFSAVGGENGQEVTANIIGIFSDAAMGVYEIYAKLGRDVIDLITRPFIDNQGTFKAAIEETLGIAAEELENVKKIVDDTFGKANNVYDQHIAPMFNSLAEGLSDIVGTLLDAYNGYILPVVEDIQKKAKTFIDNHLQPAINKALDFIGKLADGIKDIWEQVLVPFIDWFIENIAPVIGEAMETVSDLFFELAGVVSDVVGDIFDALGGLVDFITGVFTGDWSLAWEGIKTFFSEIWDAISGILGEAWNLISSDTSNAIGLVSTTISTTLDGIKNTFSEIWNSIKNTVRTVFDSIKNTISNIIGTIQTKISTALGSIKTNWKESWESVKKTVSDIFEKMWSSIKGTINSILSGVESMANGVVKGLNKMIEALNKLKWKIPDWVPELGGKSFGLDIPTIGEVSIPRLAEGGVVDRATAAIIGEAGKEAVVPLENNTGWMDKIAARIGEIISVNMMALVGEMNAGGEWQTIHTVVKLDSKTIVDQTDKYKRRQGYELKGV